MMVPADRSEFFKPDELERLRLDLIFPEARCADFGHCYEHRNEDGRTACQLSGLDPQYKEKLNLWTREFLTKMNEPEAEWANKLLLIPALWFGPATAVKFGPPGQH